MPQKYQNKLKAKEMVLKPHTENFYALKTLRSIRSRP